MPRFPLTKEQLSRVFQSSPSRQLIAWLVAVALAITVGAVGRHLQIDAPIITQMSWLFVVDSAVFLAVYRNYPKLGLVMIVFMYFLELSILGYFILAAASFGG